LSLNTLNWEHDKVAIPPRWTYSVFLEEFRGGKSIVGEERPSLSKGG